MLKALPMEREADTAALDAGPQRASRRICFFNTTPFWGGGERWHLDTAIEFRDRGHDVVVVASPGTPLFERARAAGLDTVGFRISRTSVLNPLLLWRLRRFFRERNIQIVVFNGSNDVKAGGLAAMSARVPQRIYRRGLARPIANRWLNRYLLTRGLTHIVANSSATKRALLQNFQGVVPQERVAVIHNGINLVEFDSNPFTPVFERADTSVILGNVGRLTTQKGQDFLLQVARRLKAEGVQFRLVIAGEGELEGSLRRRARELEVEAEVEFTGFVEDVPSFLKSIDVFVLSSLYEGFGYVIVEAYAARKPVVAFNINSNPEIIENGKTGFLVEPGNIEKFASKVQVLIQDDALRAAMGESGRSRVEERFQMADKVDQFESYLRE